MALGVSAFAIELNSSKQSDRFKDRPGKITAFEIKALSPVDSVVIRGVIRSSDPAFVGQMQDGCIVDIHNPDGAPEPTNDEVRYEVQRKNGSIELVWKNQCPEGNLVLAENPENPERAWLGYAEETVILCQGNRSEEYAPSIYISDDEDCKEGEELAAHQERIQKIEEKKFITGRSIWLAPLLVLFCIILFLFMNISQRSRWKKLAQAMSWDYQNRLFAPGSIRVLTEDWDLEVHLMERIGWDSEDRGHIEIRCALPDYLSPSAALALLASSRPPPDSPLHLRIRRSGLHDQAHKLNREPHRVEFDENWPMQKPEGTVSKVQKQLVWTLPGSGNPAIKQAVRRVSDLFEALRVAALAELKVLARERNWSLHVGRVIEVHTADGHRILTIDCTHSPPHSSLVLALPEGAPAGLCIQAREDHPPGMQTFDPILDKLVSMSAHNPEQIRELVRRPGLTEAVLDLVKGHGGEVVDGLVRVDRAEAMLSPTASLESIEILVGLLDKA